MNPDIISIDERFDFWDFIYTNRENEIIDEIKCKKRKMFVGIIDNEYIGGFSITSRDKDQLYLSFLVVKSNYRNRGIGSCFIDFTIQYARQLNIDKVLIGVYPKILMQGVCMKEKDLCLLNKPITKLLY